MAKPDLNPLKWGKNIIPLTSRTLDQPPCCIEFVPEKDPSLLSKYFVIGTYDLREEDIVPVEGAPEKSPTDEEVPKTKRQVWYGSLILCRLHIGVDGEEDTVQIVHTKNLPYSILDIHFFKNTACFTVVTSNGIISAYVVEEVESSHSPATQGSTENPNFEIRLKSSRDDFFSRKTWLTSFCWDDSPGTAKIVVTTDGGQVYHIELSEDATSNRKFTKVLEHTDYAWCCAVAQKGGVITSGGDDSLLRLKSMYEEAVHLESPEQLEMDIQNPQKTVKEIAKSPPKFFCRAGEIREIKGHEAGVTAILPIACTPESEPCYFLTGSYDDHIRIWMVTLDTTYPGAPDKIKCIKKYHLGGGVFRLKLLGGHTSILPIESATTTLRFKVLASCMYNGGKLLEISGGQASTDWDIKVLAEVNLHKSMVYACDAQTIPNSVQNLIPDKDGMLVPIADEAPDAHRIFVSTSFYDKLLCVWRYKSEEKQASEIEDKLGELAI